jgi:hypothetical protein
MQSAIFWDVIPDGPIEFRRRFGGTYCLHLQSRRVNQATKETGGNRQSSAFFWLVPLLAYYSTLMMQVVRSSETSLNFYRTIRRQTPEYSILLHAYVSKHPADSSEHPVGSCVERRLWEDESRQQRMQSNWFLERFSIGSSGSSLAAAAEEKGHFAGLISFICATSSMSPRLFYSWNCFSYVHKRTLLLSCPSTTFPVCTDWNCSCPCLLLSFCFKILYFSCKIRTKRSA